MALIEIKMKVYKPKPTYRNLKTISETQKEQYLKEKIRKINENNYEFEPWLEDHYTILEIFNMDDDKHCEISKEWREHCRQEVEQDFLDDYNEEEIILSVEEEELNKYESFRLIGER